MLLMCSTVAACTGMVENGKDGSGKKDASEPKVLEDGAQGQDEGPAVEDDGGGDSADENPTDQEFLSAPSGVKAVPGDGKVTLSWNPVSNASGYYIYWNQSGNVGKNDTEISNGTSPYVHNGLSNGVTYYYVVTAFDASRESEISSEVNATPGSILPCDSRFSLSQNPVVDYQTFTVSFTDQTAYEYVSLSPSGPGNPVVVGPAVTGTGPYTWTWKVDGHGEGDLTLNLLKDRHDTNPGTLVASCQVRSVPGSPLTVVPCDSNQLWCMTINTPNQVVQDLVIARPAKNDQAMLCIDEQCGSGPGGTNYGGGILVTADGVVIKNVKVTGGLIGVGIKNAANVEVRDSSFFAQSAWGIYLNAANRALIQGNQVDNANRDCWTWDHVYFPDGCESSAYMGLRVQQSTFQDNWCADSGDCYYFNGENDYKSNDNQFHGNQCFGSPHNCFELTFSTGNVISGSVTGPDFASHSCKYPFWIGCSTIYVLANDPNTWNCEISASDALQQASGCGPTQIIEQ
jgi:putative cofactor-binding repeat protein